MGRYWAQVDLAWLAGFIDGEGSIAINRSRGKSAHLEGSWVAHFNVGGTDKGTILWIAQHFNGTFSTTPSDNHYKDSHKCRWTYETGAELMPHVLPFLKTKRLQAQYYLEFVTECSSLKHGRCLPDGARKRAARLAAMCAAVADHQSRWKGLSL